MKKQAIVCHSGGMDSSLCLALAAEEFGASNILSLGFDFGQRHSIEMECAAKICCDWSIDRVVLDIRCLSQITDNALVHHDIAIEHAAGEAPNTLVTGRNGLMTLLGGIHADTLGGQVVYVGVLELEEANSGYRDCSRKYMDLIQEILRIDLANPEFEVRTPVVAMTKCETLELAHRLGLCNYLLENTISCYEGISHAGCELCPACVLRNGGIRSFVASHPGIPLPYSVS